MRSSRSIGRTSLGPNPPAPLASRSSPPWPALVGPVVCRASPVDPDLSDWGTPPDAGGDDDVEADERQALQPGGFAVDHHQRREESIPRQSRTQARRKGE